MPTLAACIASALEARENCARSGNAEWRRRHSESLQSIERNYLPSGGGFDVGTSIDLDRSRPGRLVLVTSFHHMDEGGSYDGWTDHDVIATPTFNGVSVRVTGRDRNGIKEYISEVFHAALTEDVSADAQNQEVRS